MLMDIPPGNEGGLLNDDRFLRRVAQRYYEAGETQETIAEKEACSRQMIGKALQKARDRGIVRISVVPEERTGYLQNLMRDVRSQLRLEDLVLVPGSNPRAMEDGKVADGVLADITASAADYLDHLLTNETILAVSGGKHIMRNVVRNLKPTRMLPNLQVTSTLGFIRPSTNFGDPNLIAYDIAIAYGARHYWLPTPAIVKTPEQCEQLHNLPLVGDVLQVVEKATVVMIGLWPATDNSALVKKGILSQQQVDALQAYHPVVDIDHWVFDADGNCINERMDPPPYYLTGLNIPDLKERIRKEHIKVILVAGASDAYIPGIQAVLKAGIANILITDHITAELLLKFTSGK
jgi:deoxyribonucleoside regulator